MVMMALLPPGGLLGGYGADPDGVNGSWEEACTCVSTSIRVRVALAAGEFCSPPPTATFPRLPTPHEHGLRAARAPDTHPEAPLGS